MLLHQAAADGDTNGTAVMSQLRRAVTCTINSMQPREEGARAPQRMALRAVDMIYDFLYSDRLAGCWEA